MRGSIRRGEGNVFVNGKPVCDNNWDRKDGEVVCKQLGFPGLIHVTNKSNFGQVDANFAMGDVKCDK